MKPTPSRQAVDACVAELRRHVAGDLRTDTFNRTLYSTDASLYQAMPLAVLIPRHLEDVHAAVETAARHGVPLLPRASGSSLAGQAVNEALVIDFTRHLDAVLEVDEEARTVRAEPGIVLDELNRRLRPRGLQFGPDPASSERAAVGGAVSNNSTGAHSILYGMTADHVVGMDVILSDGSRTSFGPLEPEALAARERRGGLEGAIHREIAALVRDPASRGVIREGTPRHWRRCGGYNLDRFLGDRFLGDPPLGDRTAARQDDPTYLLPPDPRFNLAKLVCGGEGGLAVMESVTLGLVPTPAAKALAAVHFGSLREALAAVPILLETGPSAVELLDHMGLTLCRDVPTYARLLGTFVEGDPDCLLLTEYYSSEGAGAGAEAELRAKLDGLAGHLRRRGAPARAVVPLLDPEAQARAWKVRKVGLGLLMSIKGDHKPIAFIEDAAVPVEHLADYIEKLESFIRGLGTDVAYYAHASAGCLHVRPLINTKDAREIAKLPEILDFSVELLRGYGGSLSSEHGDGRARSAANERFFGPDLYRLYRRVKGIFDPRGLLNPGTVVEGPAMTESLRFGADYRAPSGPEHLDWSGDGGFARAVEMCNGAGVCRKLSAGTMCPSFMVTREEEHSTRGRANLLRAALSGRLPREELTGDRMHEALDLCIECKACKAECPSSVDMAKIKMEVLSRRHEARGGPPLRSRLFAALPSLARAVAGPLAPLTASLANAGMRAFSGGPESRSASKPGAWLTEKVLGIHRRRALPTFALEPFPAWFERRRDELHARAEERPAPLPDGRREAVLFVDTFNGYQEVAVARAAARVLAAAGFRTELAEHGCCGRPALSKGLLDDARAAARRVVAALDSPAARGLPIVGLEPSCILSLRDEYLHLLPGDERARRVAARAVTFEELLGRLEESGRLRLPLGPAGRDEARGGGPVEVLLHGHCHQKALVGTEPALRVLGRIPGAAVREVDSGCCGMAGAFGYEAEHYDLSMAMAERRLLPAVRELPARCHVVAAGTSCRAQILHGAGREALHPAQLLDLFLA